jgi:uncharacterized protein (DUF305 family)
MMCYQNAHRLSRWLTLLALAFAIGLVVSPYTAVFADGSPATRNARAEVRFLEGMMDHHQMALDMANDCLKKAQTPDVTKLCQTIITAQSAEIVTMKGWLKAWYTIDYQPMSMMNAPTDMMGHDGHNDMATMPAMGGMQMQNDPPGMMGMMAGLDKLNGIAYEIAWLESMIDHHDDAVHMAQRILTRVDHAELKTLAENIIKAQTGEIDQMEALIKRLGAGSK